MEYLIRKLEKGMSNHAPSYGVNPKDGQSPDVLVVACCDSRVILQRVLSTDPGEVFVVRTVGNMVSKPGIGSAEEAAIEYGIRALGIPNIAVCGHTHCGAMQALFQKNVGAELPAVRDWLSNAEVTRQQVPENLTGAARMLAAVQTNVLVQLERVQKYPVVQEALDQTRLKLHGWIYDIESATFQVYSTDQKRFVELSTLKVPA